MIGPTRGSRTTPFRPESPTSAIPMQLPGWDDYQFGPGWTGLNNPPGGGGGGGSVPTSTPPPAVPPTPGAGAPGLPGGLPGAGGMAIEDIIKLVLAGATTVGAMTNRPQVPPEMNQLLGLQRDRMEMQTPLYQAILKLAMARMPTFAR